MISVLFFLLHAVGAPPATTPPWRSAIAIVDGAIRRRLFPGAVVVVGDRDSVFFAKGFGRVSWDRDAALADPAATLWDLASLTKVVATASAIMTLVDQGRLELDQPVARYLPLFVGEGKSAVTLRMLLDHTSGLPAFVPFYRTAIGRQGVIDQLLGVPLIAAPGTRTTYSDLNAILLGLIVEASSGTTLDRFAAQAVFSPLGMGRTTFAVADRTMAAPSIAHGGHPAPGEVNDRNAWAMGGISGHAGLFATGLDLARFAQTWLRSGAGPSGPWVGSATVRRFLEHNSPGGTRALGWEIPDSQHLDRSAFGRSATGTTYGHTGWTGTFLWFDPVRDIFLVLLTNRSLGSNARSTFRAMRELRSRLSDAAGTAMASRVHHR